MKNAKHSSSHNPPPSFSTSSRKSRWESSNPARSRSPANPKSPKPSSNDDHPPAPSSGVAVASASSTAGASLFPHPHPHLHPNAGLPSPPPPYGFHNLERRNIVLADGAVRSYFALPTDYPMDLPFDKRFPPPSGDFLEPPPPPFRRDEYWPPASMKRKYGEEDKFSRHRQHVMQYGNPDPDPERREYHDDLRMPKQARLGGEGYDRLPPPRRVRHEESAPALVMVDVDPQALKRAFLKFVRIINENSSQKNHYLEDGRNGPLQCIACGRVSKDFTDVHGLIMHTYTSQNAELRVDHLGLHKALCVFMGWNYAKAPDNSKAYQSLSADDAAANSEDLILWPPTVIIHNTNTGRRKDGRMEGMGNKEMDTKLKDLGYGGGKSKSMYGKGGHMGITLVKFADTQIGLKEAERLAENFEKDNHGRKSWVRAQSMSGMDDEKNPALVKLGEKTGDKKRILYGYLATASDLEKVDFDTRKQVIIKCRKVFDPSD